MPRLTPVSWRNFVSRMKAFGFEGPCQEGKHPYMTKRDTTLTIPNPHDGDISPDLLVRLLRQARITRSEWLKEK